MVYNKEQQDYLYKHRKRWDKLKAQVVPIIYERDGKVCASCGTTENLTIDHIIPIAKFGTNEPDNLQVLCLSCNCIKGVKT